MIEVGLQVADKLFRGPPKREELYKMIKEVTAKLKVKWDTQLFADVERVPIEILSSAECFSLSFSLFFYELLSIDAIAVRSSVSLRSTPLSFNCLRGYSS